MPPTKNATRPTLLQRFGLYFFEHKETTIVFWMALVLFGSLCYTTLMNRQGFPNVDVPISVVSGTYFVNNKTEVDRVIARPASEVIKKMPEVKRVTTAAGNNFYVLTVEYKDGVSSASGNSLVRQALNESHVLPRAATAEFKAISAGRFDEQSDLLVSVYSPNNSASVEQLQASAQKVASALNGVSGIQKTVVLKQLRTGTDPVSGAVKTEQGSFDRTGLHDLSGAIIFYNSAIVGVQAKPTTDALKLYDTTLAKINDLQHSPEYQSVRIVVSADFAESIRSQIGNLQTNLLEGLAIVILVSFLLISWRAGLVTALSMTTVLFITVAVLYATGTTLNTITLFALVLSLGLIVDDTTIMVEAIDSARAAHASQREVVLTAIKRVARASLAGTLTTMLAFAPMLFISGILGNFIRILPTSIIISLAVSLVISLSLVPFAARFLLPRKRKSMRFKNPVGRIEKKMAGGLARMVQSGQKSVLKRFLFGAGALLISAVMLLASFPLFAKLKFDIFPNTKNSNELMLTLTFPDGTTLNNAQLVADRANLIIGDTLGKNMKKLSYLNTGSVTAATADITLTDYKQREATSPQLVASLQKSFNGFDGAAVRVSQVDAGPPKDEYPFAVQIYSEKEANAQAAAKAIQSYLQNRSIKRVNGTSARIVRTKLASSDTITRRAGDRYIELRAGYDADDVSALVTQTKTAVKDAFPAQKLQTYGIAPSQLVYDFGSESNNQDSFKSMLVAFPVLLLLMYLLLMYQFKSFLQPLLIIIAIPFSFFGVAAGLYKTHNPLSFFVMVGFFALIGIAVNNTILLTDYANQAQAAGQNKYEAMATALRARFRPLITTSLTSVVALIPLALSDPFWESLSVTLIFGLLSSTFLVIIAFPYLYLINEWLRHIGHRWWQRRLWQPLQWLLDVVFLPIRLLRFFVWVAFAWRKS